ncbi:proteophosphoglycan 5 [Actinosynnema pretiosum subsp. pretiosum]|nr:proteophosphoglycan 5 [Actinosynnema pretiosum subsp. pretiosum]
MRRKGASGHGSGKRGKRSEGASADEAAKSSESLGSRIGLRRRRAKQDPVEERPATTRGDEQRIGEQRPSGPAAESSAEPSAKTTAQAEPVSIALTPSALSAAAPIPGAGADAGAPTTGAGSSDDREPGHGKRAKHRPQRHLALVPEPPATGPQPVLRLPSAADPAVEPRQAQADHPETPAQEPDRTGHSSAKHANAKHSNTERAGAKHASTEHAGSTPTSATPAGDAPIGAVPAGSTPPSAPTSATPTPAKTPPPPSARAKTRSRAERVAAMNARDRADEGGGPDHEEPEETPR